MIGKELARQIRRHKGKIAVTVFTATEAHCCVWVEKKDLAEWAERYGDKETGMRLYEQTHTWYFEKEPD